ncbi:MAG: AI-2E family transporter, partial [Clostridium baratii]|nr:AI-2E family transporter [Clostridium baratii]
DSTNIHPLVIIILLLIGERMFGVFGMIMAVPLGVIIKVIYDDLNYYLF